jgi:hypothetical protein
MLIKYDAVSQLQKKIIIIRGVITNEQEYSLQHACRKGKQI